MRTVTVKFDLPEDQYEMEEYLRGPAYRAALDETVDYLRQLYKYRSDEVAAMSSLDLLDMIRDHVAKLLPPETT